MEIVLPYVGSKKRFLSVLRESIPQNHLYVEPFAGGFSLGLNLLEEGLVTNAVLNDLDTDVYNFWALLKEDYWLLASEIDELILLHNNLVRKIDKWGIKAEFDKLNKSKVTQTALFYLYKKMNMGSSRQSIKEDLSFGKMAYTDVFMKASMLLEGATVENKNYSELDVYDSKGTLWYFDPPYYNAQNSQYYKECKEEVFNHKKLRDFVSSLWGNFILSYDDCPEIRELYSCYNIYELKVPSRLNTLGYSKEVIISNMDLTLGDFEYKIEKGGASAVKFKGDDLKLSDLFPDD